MDVSKAKLSRKRRETYYLINKGLTRQVLLGYAHVYRRIYIMRTNIDIHQMQQPAFSWNSGMVELNASAKIIFGDICRVQSTDDDEFLSLMESHLGSFTSTLLTSKGEEILVEIHFIEQNICLLVNCFDIIIFK